MRCSVPYTCTINSLPSTLHNWFLTVISMNQWQWGHEIVWNGTSGWIARIGVDWLLQSELSNVWMKNESFNEPIRCGSAFEDDGVLNSGEGKRTLQPNRLKL